MIWLRPQYCPGSFEWQYRKCRANFWRPWHNAYTDVVGPVNAHYAGWLFWQFRWNEYVSWEA